MRLGCTTGRIPVQFELAAADADEPFEPFYLLAPRGGYLTLCVDKIRRHFQSDHGAAADPVMWFEYKDRPLKWNHPIGVLYDSFAASEGLPWRVQVHTSGYPGDQLIPYTGIADVEAHFVSQLKQASFIKHGTSQAEGLQSESDRKQLWLGLANDDYEQFRGVNEKLMTPKGGNWFKRAPFRIYMVTLAVLSDPMARVTVIDQPYPTIRDDGTPQTLADLLEHLELNRATAPGVVTLHGVSPPLDTPLQWLAEHLPYPDNILHLVWRQASPLATDPVPDGLGN